MLAYLFGFGVAILAACSSPGSNLPREFAPTSPPAPGNLAAPGPALSATPSAAPTASPSPSPQAQLVYASYWNGTTMQVSAFATNGGGNVVPVKTIGGSQTQLSYPQSMAFDSAGNLYVVNAGFDPSSSGTPNPSITVYARGSSGNVAPIRVIAGPNTGFTGASGLGGLAIDASGRLYVPEHNGSDTCTPYGCTIDVGDTIAIFAPNASGNSAPARTISSSACYSAAGIALAPSGNIEVACSDPSAGGTLEGDIVTFAPGASGNATPVNVVYGPSRGFSAIARSPLGMLFVTGQYPFLAVLEYPETAGGNATPANAFEPNGWYPAALAEDANSTLYVLNSSSPASIWEYGSTATSSSSPMFVISGSNTGLPNCGGSSSTSCGVGGTAVGPP